MKKQPSKGAPSKYTQEIADSICEAISTSTKSLRVISTENGIDYATVKRWLASKEDFCAQYARAKEDQADHIAEEIIEIADDSSNDTKVIKGKDGKDIEVENTEWTSRSKLRVEARKWAAGKLKPKKYGDQVKVDATHSGTLQITGMTIK